MKKYQFMSPTVSLTLTIALAILSTNSIAYAQQDQSAAVAATTVKAGNLSKTTSTVATTGVVASESKIVIKAKLSDKQLTASKAVVNAHLMAEGKMFNNLKIRLAKLKSIALKMKAAGKDTSAGDQLIVAADAKLTDVTAQLSIIVSTLGKLSVSSNTEFTTIQSALVAASADIKAAHQDIADAISSLKGLGTVSITVDATTTTKKPGATNPAVKK